MSKMFRSSPMGFNKKDVVDYIEKFAKEKDAVISTGEETIKTLEKENSDLAGYRDQAITLMDRTEELREENESLAGERDSAMLDVQKERQEKAELEDRIKEFESQLKEAQAEAQIHKTAISELTDENKSLKKHNLRLLELNEELNAEISRKKKADQREQAQAKASELYSDIKHGAKSAQELFDIFKKRIIEISKELSSLAQAILDAEKREGRDEEKYDDFAVGEEDYSGEYDYDDDDDDNETSETQVVIDNYPVKRSRGEYPRRGLSVREIIDRVKNIGDRML
ncbi:MAG: hypothetical protein VB078_02985 [Clostridiaceae bacterium]|nr:hypothetical protein [Clostridiaceae bacterium]